mgnify:CR=1 FL=1
MRLLPRRRKAVGEEDEEIMSRVRRISNRPRIRPGNNPGPSKEAVEVYVEYGLRELENALRSLGASEDEVREALRLAKKTLTDSYPNPVNTEELARQLLGMVRTPQGGPRHRFRLPWA